MLWPRGSILHEFLLLTGNKNGRSVQVQGQFKTGCQYHFYLENHVCLVRPEEEGQFEVISSTQYMDKGQYVIAKTLGIDANKINVKVFIANN